MGNTNFSIMLPRLLFTRNHGAELVAKAVRERLGVEQCTVNERNDVIIRDGERDLKVSPSLYDLLHELILMTGFRLCVQDHSAQGLSSWHNAHFIFRRGAW